MQILNQEAFSELKDVIRQIESIGLANEWMKDGSVGELYVNSGDKSRQVKIKIQSNHFTDIINPFLISLMYKKEKLMDIVSVNVTKEHLVQLYAETHNLNPENINIVDVYPELKPMQDED